MYPVFFSFVISITMEEQKNCVSACTHGMIFGFFLFLLENQKLFGIAMVVLPIYRRYVCMYQAEVLLAR